MPEAGIYLLSNAGFTKDEKPYISLQNEDRFIDHLVVPASTVSMQFDTIERFCIGWGDITTGERFICPDKATLDPKYEQCPACQKRTGFNPAFYHASSVSKQQEARNLQPHILYLAYFGNNLTKVGISLAARGKSRLLEQGARSAIILDTFPSAHIARQYEAKIAALPAIAETVLLRKKVEIMRYIYDPQTGEHELLKAKDDIEKTLGTQFTNSAVLHFDSAYFPASMPHFPDAFDCTSHNLISGETIGALGTLLFCYQQDTPLFLPLKKYVGYKVKLSYSPLAMTLPARQISLF